MSSMLLARGSLVVERTCRHAPRCSSWWWWSYQTRSSLSASSTRFSSSVVPFGSGARPPSSSSCAWGDLPTLPRSDDVRPFATALHPRAVVDPDSTTTTGSSSFAAAAAVPPHKKTARRRVRRKRITPSPSSPKGRGTRRGPSDRPRRRGRGDGPRPSSVASSSSSAAASSPLRVFKLEQRLTYLYSSYLATMGVVVDNDDVDGRRRPPRRGGPSSSVRSRPRGVPLPFFAGVPTDDLGRALRESADVTWSSRRVESTDADGLRARLVASEEEYRRLQEVTRVVAKGWTVAEAPWATTRDDRDDRETDAVADHARAEAWWDQMERARRQRCVAVDEYRAAEREQTTWFRAATSFLRRALSSNDDDRADDDGGAVAIDGVTAHASPEYGPTTKSYALVAGRARPLVGGAVGQADALPRRRAPPEPVRGPGHGSSLQTRSAEEPLRGGHDGDAAKGGDAGGGRAARSRRRAGGLSRRTTSVQRLRSNPPSDHGSALSCQAMSTRPRWTCDGG